MRDARTVFSFGSFESRSRQYGFECTGQETRAFSQMMYHLNASLLSGDTFSRCIEQDFEVPEVDRVVFRSHVRHNKVFLEAFFNGLKVRSLD